MKIFPVTLMTGDIKDVEMHVTFPIKVSQKNSPFPAIFF